MRNKTLLTARYQRLRQALGGADVFAAGLYTRLLQFTYVNAYLGNVGAHATDEDIAVFCGWETIAGAVGRDPSPESFVELMDGCGVLIRVDGPDRLIVAGWSEEAGTAQKRLAKRYGKQFADIAHGFTPADPDDATSQATDVATSQATDVATSQATTDKTDKTDRQIRQTDKTDSAQGGDAVGARSRDREDTGATREQQGADDPPSDPRTVPRGDQEPPGMTETEGASERRPDPSAVPRDPARVRAMLAQAGVRGQALERLATEWADAEDLVGACIEEARRAADVRNVPGWVIRRLDNGYTPTLSNRERRWGAIANAEGAA